MPQSHNLTPLTVELVPAIDATGRTVGVVIGKVAFDVGQDGRLSLCATPAEIDYVDVPPAGGDPGDIARPSDFCDGKPLADVLILAPETSDGLRGLHSRTVTLEVGPLRVAKRVGDAWPLGPMRRDRQPRLGHAGTYDGRWMRERMPLLPADFDPRYHQCSPEDQRVRLSGDEVIRVSGLTDAPLNISLPGRCMLVSGHVRSRYFTAAASLDTVVLESSRPRLTLVWRHTIETPQKFDDIGNVFVHLVRLRALREVYGS